MTGRYGESLPAREIAVQELNSLRGRLYSTVEALGLPKTQERAIITLIKNQSYQGQAIIEELFKRLDPNEDSRFTYTGRVKRENAT